MRRVAFLLLLTSTLAAAPAFAVGGLNLASGACLGDGGANQAFFACNTNTGTAMTLYASVIVPHQLPQLIGVETRIDVQVDAPNLPPWWQNWFGACRSFATQPNYSPVGVHGACPDIWGGNAPLASSVVQTGIGGPNHSGIISSGALTLDVAQSIPVDGVTEYNVCRVTVSASKSTGTGACAGCTTGACFVLNKIYLYQPFGVGDYSVSNPANVNYVVYNGSIAAGPCPAAVPARNRTWGAVKSLYR